MLDRKTGENEETYIFRLGMLKKDNKINLSWGELADIINKNCGYDKNESAYRKPFQYICRFLEAGALDDYKNLSADDIKKERIKLQTLNIERNRLNRTSARQELYYEYVADACKVLELPKFSPLYNNTDLSADTKYIVTLADIHYGATFVSENNEYSPEICKMRLEKLCAELIKFVNEKQINTLSIIGLGDTIQGILRLSDLIINDSNIVKSTVQISRILALFLNELSKVCNIEYYHVPHANHTQLRVLNAKASELANEDMEYVIVNYISDLLRDNPRIKVHMSNDNQNYIGVKMHDFNILAMHGHNIKDVNNLINNLNVKTGRFVDYIFLGHFHQGKEILCNEFNNYDTEILLCPSFIGSDPYSDSLMLGNKSSVKIFGFDKKYGHTESYKIILN